MKHIDIIIVRHGETALNKDGRIRGWSDVPLDEAGRKHAKKTGKKLKGKIDAIVCSDLDRTQETAYLISKETGVPIKWCTKKFRPWHVGDFTGEKVDKVHPEMAKMAREHPDEKIKNGESFNAFKERFLSAVEELLDDYEGERIALVTHHRGDRIFAAWHKKGFPSDHKVDIGTFLTEGLEPGDAAPPVEYP